MKPVILLYHLDENTAEGAALLKILNRRGLSFRKIRDDQLQDTIGHLAGLPGYDSAVKAGSSEVSGPDAHLMVMCGITEHQLNQLLLDLRSAGVRIPYKAMMTETNKDFTAAQLLTEIRREHAMMQLAAARKKL